MQNVRYFTLTDYEPFYNVVDIKNIFNVFNVLKC